MAPKFSHKFLFFILACWLAACSQPRSRPFATPTIRIAFQSTTPLSTARATLAPTSTTPPTVTVTPTSTPDPRLVYHCVYIAPTLSQDASFEGTLAIKSRSSESDDYLLNLKNGTRLPLGDIWDMAVSPDGRKLAYQPLSSNSLIVADEQNRSLATFFGNSAPISSNDNIIGWLDNDQILLQIERETSDYEEDKLPALVIFNPVTKDHQEFLPEDYPNLVNHPEPDAVSWLRSRIVLDPSITRLVYPSFGISDESPIILWDILSNREINRIYSRVDYGNTPAWFPDGSQVIVIAPMVYTSPAYGNQIENMPGEPTVGGEELVGMSRDGLLKRLTYLTNTYVAHPGAMSLSPDGRYIAYWLTIEDSPYPGERLAVADLLTGNVTNYCIAGYPDRSFGGSGPPVWSPDGKGLAVTYPVKKPEDRFFDTNVLVLDLEREVAAQVAESAAVYGWMLPAP